MFAVIKREAHGFWAKWVATSLASLFSQGWLKQWTSTSHLTSTALALFFPVTLPNKSNCKFCTDRFGLVTIFYLSRIHGMVWHSSRYSSFINMMSGFNIYNIIICDGGYPS